MKCRTCGAKINHKSVKCTSCGKEINTGKRSDKAVKKSTSSLLIVGIALIVISILLLTIIKSQNLTDNNNYTEHTIAMEEYFRAKDYENIYTYVINNSIPYTGYEKYVQIYEVCALTHDIKNSHNSLNKELIDDNYDIENTRLLIQSIVSRCITGINTCNTYLTDYNELGNEDALRYFSYYFKSFLSDNLYFLDEDISKMCSLNQITSSTLEPFVTQAYITLTNRN